jgi:23S rRNA (adenine2503-C2)-methyltransferase
MRVAEKAESADGATRYLLTLDDGLRVEAVFLKFGELGRDSICISSQVGCPYTCRFCVTGTVGYARNLSAEEIVGEALTVFEDVGYKQIRPFEFSFMGMGEPMLNLDAVIGARRLMERRYDGFQYCISTVGIIPKIEELTRRGPFFALQVSLHAPTDELRTRLIPSNKVYPIAALLEAAERYAETAGELVALNYCLMGGVNDSLEQADELAELVVGRPFLVKLLNYNPHAAVGGLQPTSPGRLTVFLEALRSRGVNAISRAQLGIEDGAGCGQLDADYVVNELRRRPRLVDGGSRDRLRIINRKRTPRAGRRLLVTEPGTHPQARGAGPVRAGPVLVRSERVAPQPGADLSASHPATSRSTFACQLLHDPDSCAGGRLPAVGRCCGYAASA